MRRHPSRAISALLNLASVVLVLPGCVLALHFLAVHYLARHTAGDWLRALWDALDWLPAPEQLPFVVVAALLAAGAAVAATIWLPPLLPCLVLATGIASLAYIVWAVGVADIGMDPVIWLGMLGIGLSLWQVYRVRLAQQRIAATYPPRA